MGCGRLARSGEESGSWEFRLQIFNLTDEENGSPPHPVSRTDSLRPELPIRVEGTVKYKC